MTLTILKAHIWSLEFGNYLEIGIWNLVLIIFLIPLLSYRHPGRKEESQIYRPRRFL
jgi:hypothetical protein